MRRLPIYLLLDTSGSMYGEPIEAVKNGIQVLYSALKGNAYALETAYLSIITFDSNAKQILPLTEVAQLQTPEISASGCTVMGEALKLAAERASQEVAKNTFEQKGDWKPMMFIMTDGAPTDDLDKGLAEFNKEKWGMVVACAAGSGAHTDTLKKITSNVVKLDTTDKGQIEAFFKWVSQSVITSSQKVEEGGAQAETLSELPPPPPEVNIVL